MFEMRLQALVNQLVSHHLDQCLDNEALHFSFDLEMSSIAYSNAQRKLTSGKELRQRCGLQLLYHKINRGSHISVFSAVTKSPFDRVEEVGFWKHEVTHDSCWRDVNAINQLYFSMAEKINKDRKAHGDEEIAPANMMQYSRFAGIGLEHAFSWIPVEVIRDPSDESNYRKILTVKM